MAVPDQPALRIRLLGELEVRRGDAVLALPASRRTRALLGFLVARGVPELRATLCDLLWDGPDDPRACLRWSLTKLRAVVDDGQAQRIAADRERAGFQPLQCEVDTVELQALLSRGLDAMGLAALEQAARLLQGEFLDGLDLPACYRYHHWCMGERERYGALRRSVLQALVERLGGDAGRALPWGRAMVAADPLEQAAHATLVRLLAADGRYPEAEQHYEWARELLRREVAMPDGGPLDEAIRRARRQLREGASVPVPAARSAPGDVAAIDARTVEGAAPLKPLVGREAERAAIAQAVAGAGGRTELLLFCGEPGIGKTRLLDHLADTSAAAGLRVVRGRCFEAEMVRPYGLWLDALQGVATAGVPAETLQRAAPLLAGRAGDSGNREQLFGAAAALVASLAKVQPLALLLDDLQWIDEGSAALLHYIARTPADAPAILLGGAARAGEVEDNTWAKGLLQSLAREDRLRQHDLAPLEAPAARLLLGDAAGALDPADALRQSGGNPLYLLELARAAQRGTGGGGRSMGALIEERLRALDAPGRELLAWAAAMGRELRPELLAAAADLPLSEVLARLERFARRGLVGQGASGHFDFSHDLVRDAVYRALSQPQRRAIHRQIARALGAASAGDTWLHGEIVRHAALAGDVPVAARACLAAGEHCLRLFANDDAAAVAERGLSYVDELPRNAQRVRLEIGLLRLRVGAAAGPGGRRLPALAGRIERAIALAEALELPSEAASGWELLAFWQQQANEVALTQQATLAAERMTRHTDAATHCRQLANTGRCLFEIEADAARGRELIAQAGAMADELGLKLMEVEWGRGLVARADGDLDAARAALARGVSLGALADNHWREYECMLWLATVELESGRFADVQRVVDDILAGAGRMGMHEVPFAQALAAIARLRLGWAEAQAALDANVAALRDLDDKAHLAYVLNEAAQLALEAGRFDQAQAFAEQALAAAVAVRRTTEIDVATARLATAARKAGRGVEAIATLQPGADAAPSARAAAALAGLARRISTPAPTGRA